jgi:acyl-coenzyme A synthetase/AMP-(fatty) acid ligase
VSELPKSPAGKILKRELKKKVLEAAFLSRKGKQA